jgi:hypothetical protein
MPRLAFRSALLAAITGAAGIAHAALPQELATLQAPPPQAAPAPDDSMQFRMVTGRGVLGLTRWVQASGRISPETPARFEALAREHRLRGVTVALESGGGSLLDALRAGRAFRAAGVDTIVGRTVVRSGGGEDATLVTHGTLCASACTYLFLGGVERRFPATARFGVHQFTPRIGADGRPVAERPNEQDFMGAQQVSAHLAVYIQEMGADARLMVAAASVPYGQQLRFLSPGEVADLRAGVTVNVDREAREAVGWSRNIRPDHAVLYRFNTRQADGERRIDEELMLGCTAGDTALSLSYRLVQTRRGGGAAVRLPELRIGMGESGAIGWAPTGAGPSLEGDGDSVWVLVRVERKLAEAAARERRLTVRIPAAAGAGETSELADGLAEALPGLVAACDAQNARSLAAR